ncbi:hypothetical protein [Salinicola salarius]|uniref:hypothetical protein n=1 Tax=Salinicola salarius TaxID=430457 RepID=UPI0013004C09|nr:hypothetical protein [Salinicola salarius]
MKKILLIFTGFNQRAAIAFLRCAAKSKVNFRIVSCGDDDPINTTTYLDRIIYRRRHKGLDIELMRGIREAVLRQDGLCKIVLLPTSEYLNRFLLQNRGELEELGYIIPLVDRILYESLSDKESFSQICRSFNIEVPKEMSVYKLGSTFVAKPRTYRESLSAKPISPVLVNSEEKRKEFFDNYNLDSFYFQEYLIGESVYLLYYFARGQVLKFSQKNILQQPDGKSILAAEPSTFHMSEYSKIYEKMLLDLGFQGLVMVEVKLNESGCYMIEANPRLWGPSQLLVDNNVGFFEAFIQDWCGAYSFYKPRDYACKQKKYFWFGGLCQTLRENKFPVRCATGQSEKMFEVNDWMKFDIYSRKDSVGIFLKELL